MKRSAPKSVVPEGCSTDQGVWACRGWCVPPNPIRCDRFRADEPQLVLGRALNKLVMDPLEAVGIIRLPWLAA